jgi:hypothetical protein
VSQPLPKREIEQIWIMSSEHPVAPFLEASRARKDPQLGGNQFPYQDTGKSLLFTGMKELPGGGAAGTSLMKSRWPTLWAIPERWKAVEGGCETREESEPKTPASTARLDGFTGFATNGTAGKGEGRR